MGWEELEAIHREQAEIVRDEMRATPDRCPIDGAVLQLREDGVLNCPMGNYRIENVGYYRDGVRRR